MTKRLLNKKVVKQTVGNLKKALQDADDDCEVLLAFYYKGEVHHAYLAEILTNLKYDGVIKETFENSSVVELTGFEDDHSKYEVEQ